MAFTTTLLSWPARRSGGPALFVLVVLPAAALRLRVASGCRRGAAGLDAAATAPAPRSSGILVPLSQRPRLLPERTPMPGAVGADTAGTRVSRCRGGPSNPRAPHSVRSVLRPLAGRKLLDREPLSTDPRAHRAIAWHPTLADTTEAGSSRAVVSLRRAVTNGLPSEHVGSASLVPRKRRG